jgi:hypothetical protein
VAYQKKKFMSVGIKALIYTVVAIASGALGFSFDNELLELLFVLAFNFAVMSWMVWRPLEEPAIRRLLEFFHPTAKPPASFAA